MILTTQKMEKFQNKAEETPFNNEAAKASADRNLYQKVIAALRFNHVINSEKIRVRVKNGRVYLEGTVITEAERILAEKCIADLFGVWTISNGLTFPFDAKKGQR